MHRSKTIIRNHARCPSHWQQRKEYNGERFSTLLSFQVKSFSKKYD